MGKIYVFFVLAILCTMVFGKDIRHKRQSNPNDEELDDRYGWDRPRGPGQGQGGRFPGQGGQFPGQGGQFPGQGNQFPGQGGRFPGQGGQFPGQGGQFPGQGGQFPGQGGQFPGQGGQMPGQGGQQTGQGNQGQQIPSSTESPTVQECMRNCPVTAEYNPVCGDNNITYSNPGRLTCAQSCGLNVNLLRSAPCPATTTAAPS